MMNAIFMFSRDASIIMNLFDTPMVLFSGARIPSSCFPLWGKIISLFFPLTYCINIIRLVLKIQENSRGWLDNMIGLLICLGIMILVTVFLTRKAEAKNRKTGEIQFY